MRASMCSKSLNKCLKLKILCVRLILIMEDTWQPARYFEVDSPRRKSSREYIESKTKTKAVLLSLSGFPII
jgi:hypothetical protein